MTRRLLGAAAGLLLTVAGCTSTPVTSDPRPDAPHSGQPATKLATGEANPHLVGAAAPPVEIAPAVPMSWSDSVLVDTGWQVPPQVQGRFMVGFTEAEDGLIYSAIDSYGTVLWEVMRPKSCTGFAVSYADDEPIVVLTDAMVNPETDTASATWQTTATAYDLATGTPVWGPVAVPGTVQGPGVVFGASAPAATLGEVGPRLALDPATGAVIADEADSPDTAIIGEFNGTLISRTGTTVTATDTATETQLWAADSGTVSAAPVATHPVGAALLATDAGIDAIDIATGAVIATGIDSADFEPLAQIWVVAEDRTVTGQDAEGEIWARTLPESATIAVSGLELTYLKTAGMVHVLNTVTGEDAVAYPYGVTSGYAIPTAITDDAAGLFHVDGKYLLATNEEPPE